MIRKNWRRNDKKKTPRKQRKPRKKPRFGGQVVTFMGQLQVQMGGAGGGLYIPLKDYGPDHPCIRILEDANRRLRKWLKTPAGKKLLAYHTGRAS